jgi:hypothetical protein
MKIGTDVQMLLGGTHIQHTQHTQHTHIEQGDLISLLVIFQNKESSLQLTIIATHLQNYKPNKEPLWNIKHSEKHSNKNFWLFQNFQLYILR